MVFTEESTIVKTWVRLVNNGEYTRDKIPNLGNLRVVVIGILDKQ